MWIRVASVVVEMFHMFSSGFCGLEMFLMVSCGRQGTPDVSCGFV